MRCGHYWQGLLSPRTAPLVPTTLMAGSMLPVSVRLRMTAFEGGICHGATEGFIYFPLGSAGWYPLFSLCYTSRKTRVLRTILEKKILLSTLLPKKWGFNNLSLSVKFEVIWGRVLDVSGRKFYPSIQREKYAVLYPHFGEDWKKYFSSLQSPPDTEEENNPLYSVKK